MQIAAVTIGIAVRDLDRAVAWYRSALQLPEPDLVPTDAMVEFDLGAFWLQLALAPDRAGCRGATVNISVEDVSRERQRLAAGGFQVTEVQRFAGAVDYFELTDLDGNMIGFVTELD